MSGRRARVLRTETFPAPSAARPTSTTVLGEDLELLLPIVESVVYTPGARGGMQTRARIEDEQVLPYARALLRAQADVLTEEEAVDLANCMAPRALLHLIMQVFEAPASGTARERQSGALLRHHAELMELYPQP